MPSVTPMELDSLIDRRGGGGSSRRRRHNDYPSFDLRERRDLLGGETVNGSLTVDVRRTSNFPNHFSPALYATPQPSRISGSSPTPASPSPYVVNIKRRDFRLPPRPVSASNELEEGGDVGGRRDSEMEEEEDRLVEEGKARDMPVNGVCGETSLLGSGGLDEKKAGVDEIDDFFDPRYSTSVMSISDTEDGSDSRRRVPGKDISVSTNSEFYDATEDFFSDSSTSHPSPLHSNTEADCCSLRLNLFEEIEKRKNAEHCLSHLQRKWKKTATYFTYLGLPFPAIPDRSDIHHEADEIAQVCQEIVVARYVSEALERIIAHADVEESVEMIIKSKNHEISRLHDRLQYYEAMNHEMSQRNQKNIELARWKRQQRRRRNKLLWCSIGLSVTLGASLLAYSFKPQDGGIGDR